MSAPEHKAFWLGCRRALRWTRRFLLLLLLFVAGSFLYLNLAGVPGAIKRRLEAQLRERGLDLQLGRVRLRGFRGFVAENVRLGSGTEAQGFQFFIPEADLRLKSKELRGFRFALETIDLQGARLVWFLSASNAPTARLLVEDLATELRFPEGDEWELGSLRGRFLNAKLEASGKITHAAALQKWFASSTGRKEEPLWPARLHALATQLQRVSLASPSAIALRLEGDGRDPTSLQLVLKCQVPSADTPWGKFEGLQLQAGMTPAEARQDGTDATLRLVLGTAQGDWGNLKQTELSAHFVGSATNQNSLRGEWRLSSSAIHSRWADAENIHLTATTGPLTNRTAPFRTTLNLETKLLRTGWGQSSQNQVTAEIGHALDSFQGWEANWRLAAKQAESRWATCGDLQLTGRTARAALAPGLRKADASWAAWRKLEPFEIQWQAQLGPVVTPEAKVEQIEFGGHWRAPELTLRKLRADFGRGHFDASAQLNVGTCELKAQTEFDFDGHQIASLLTTNAQRWLRQFTWATPPRVTSDVRLILPAWTNAQPNWEAEVVPTIQLAGTFAGTQGSFRKFAVTSARAHFSLTNSSWHLPDFVLTSPQGQVQLGYRWNMQTRDFVWDVDSRMDPQALRPFFEEPEQGAFDSFAFAEPPVIRGKVWGRWREPDRIGISAQVAATNFVFRGERCSDFTTTVQFTNRFFYFTDTKIRRDEQRVVAPAVGYDLVGEAVYVTNAVSTMDPDLVTRLIGPRTREAIEPYQFKTPPTVRVNGRLPTRDSDQADVRFEVSGQSFRYWKFSLPKVSGDVHWQGDHLSITNVQAGFYNGQLAWSGHFDFSAPKGADFSFRGRVTEADLQLLMADLSAKTNRLEGTLNGELIVTAANSADPRSWRGQGSVHVRDGLLWDIPIFGFLSPWLNKVAPPLGNSRASAATATFTLRDGAFQTDDLETRSPALRLQYAGRVDFKGPVDARVQAEILRDAPAVGRILSLALWPITKAFEYKITGTINEPEVRPLYIPKILFWPFKPLQTLKNILPHEDPKRSPAPQKKSE